MNSHHLSNSQNDNLVVASYCNIREGTGYRVRSTILHLQNFINWVKIVMFNEFAGGRSQKALELACGKGGDLGKWNGLAVTQVTGVDIAAVSLQHAQERYRDLRPKYECKFIEFDAFRKPFTHGLLPHRFYDTISCQFAFHYAFESLDTARIAIQNVSSSLAHGGYLIGTIPNAAEIMRRLQSGSTDGQTLKGKLYKIVFDKPVDMTVKRLSHFGMRYLFSMVDALDNCPEFLIPMPVLKSMCKDAGLTPVQEFTFPRFYDHFSKMSEYGHLLERMRIIEEWTDSSMVSSSELDVASPSTAFVFHKEIDDEAIERWTGGCSEVGEEYVCDVTLTVKEYAQAITSVSSYHLLRLMRADKQTHAVIVMNRGGAISIYRLVRLS